MAGGKGLGGPMGHHGRGFLTEEEKANRPKITAALLKRIASYLLPYWKQVLIVIVALIAGAVFSLIPSILTGRIIDQGLIGRNLHALITLILLALGVILLSNLIGTLENYLNSWIAQHISYDMRNTMYRHMQRMSHRFFTSSKQGRLLKRQGVYTELYETQFRRALEDAEERAGAAGNTVGFEYGAG